MAIYLILGVLVLIFGGIGVGLIIYALRTRQKVQESQRWPVTDGLITAREMAVNQSTDSEGGSTTSYYPHVEYEYSVMGTRYHGKKIAFGAVKNYSRQADVQAILARYPEGATVAVHYDPNKPEDAVLEQAAPATNVMVVIGVIFLAVALCGGFVGLGVLLMSAFGN